MRRWIFDRLGWTGPVVMLAAVILQIILLRSIFGTGYFNSHDHWYIPMIFIMVGCIAMTAVGYYLNTTKRGVVVDRYTREPREAPAHTFLTVPVDRLGAMLFAASAVLTFYVGLISG